MRISKGELSSLRKFIINSDPEKRSAMNDWITLMMFPERLLDVKENGSRVTRIIHAVGDTLDNTKKLMHAAVLLLKALKSGLDELLQSVEDDFLDDLADREEKAY